MPFAAGLFVPNIMTYKGLKDGMTHQANTNLEIGHNCLLWQPVMLCLTIMVPAHFHDVTDDKIW